MKPELPGNSRAGRTPSPSAAPEDDLLRQFDQAWHQGQPPQIKEYLTRLAAIRQTTDPRSCRAFLEELVKSDLEYRWRMPPPLPSLGTASPAIRSVQPRLEDYAASFADLGPLHQLSIDLIAEEYWVRHSFADRPAQADYQGRRAPVDVTAIVAPRQTQFMFVQIAHHPGDRADVQERFENQFQPALHPAVGMLDDLAPAWRFGGDRWFRAVPPGTAARQEPRPSFGNRGFPRVQRPGAHSQLPEPDRSMRQREPV